MDPERPSDVEQRKALVVARGLPCVVRLRRNGAFSCLDLHPAPGWTHLVSYPDAEAFGAYHVSLGYGVSEDLLATIAARWDGTATVVAIAWVRDTFVAMLAWEGLGGDSDVWADLEEGYPGRGFGLHVSM